MSMLVSLAEVDGAGHSGCRAEVRHLLGGSNRSVCPHERAAGLQPSWASTHSSEISAHSPGLEMP